ncbi:hypothetical protein Tco_1118384, partial [Tanacetum coccineum]
SSLSKSLPEESVRYLLILGHMLVQVVHISQRYKYAVSSLMDMAYRVSEQYSLEFFDEISCVIFLVVLRKMPPKKNNMSEAAIHNGGGRTTHTAPVCTYKKFLNCQPLKFKGTEGDVGLAYWFEEMKSVFHINNCIIECQVKSEIKKYGIPKWFRMNQTKVEKYIDGLLISFLGYVMASKPTKLHEAIDLARSLMAQKVLNYATRQTENKRRTDNNSGNNHDQQPPYKRQNVARAYAASPGENREYVGTLPMCNKCKFHHNGSCAAKCPNCKRVGHLAYDCMDVLLAINNQRAPGEFRKFVTLYVCEIRLYKSDCPKLKNKNHGNQTGNGEARGKAYALGGGESNPDLNVVTGTFLLNNRYASILFDTGVDRSFMSTTFNSLIDIASSTLDNSYDIELADRRLGSFNAIIGMDWMSMYHAVIFCDEKIKYLLKGCHLACITEKKTEDKSEEKRPEDVPVVRHFPEVCPEGLSGFPPTRQVEFQIELVPGDAHVPRVPYRLAPSEMNKLTVKNRYPLP